MATGFLLLFFSHLLSRISKPSFPVVLFTFWYSFPWILKTEQIRRSRCFRRWSAWTRPRRKTNGPFLPHLVPRQTANQVSGSCLSAGGTSCGRNRRKEGPYAEWPTACGLLAGKVKPGQVLPAKSLSAKHVNHATCCATNGLDTRPMPRDPFAYVSSPNTPESVEDAPPGEECTSAEEAECTEMDSAAINQSRTFWFAKRYIIDDSRRVNGVCSLFQNRRWSAASHRCVAWLIQWSYPNSCPPDDSRRLLWYSTRVFCVWQILQAPFSWHTTKIS